MEAKDYKDIAKKVLSTVLVSSAAAAVDQTVRTWVSTKIKAWQKRNEETKKS